MAEVEYAIAHNALAHARLHAAAAIRSFDAGAFRAAEKEFTRAEEELAVANRIIEEFMSSLPRRGKLKEARLELLQDYATTAALVMSLADRLQRGQGVAGLGSTDLGAFPSEEQLRRALLQRERLKGPFGDTLPVSVRKTLIAVNEERIKILEARLQKEPHTDRGGRRRFTPQIRYKRKKRGT